MFLNVQRRLPDMKIVKKVFNFLIRADKNKYPGYNKEAVTREY